MPFSGSGSFSVYTPGNPAVTGTTISSTSFNNTMNDFATGLTNTITRDGQSPATSNIPLGNNKITGLANGTARTDAAPVGQVQDGGFAYLSGVAGTNTITASLSPAITAYVAGQTFRFAAAGANTGAVTINVNGIGAKAVTKNGTSALITGDILANAVYSVTYDGTQFQISGALFNGGSFASSGANSDITSLSGLTTPLSIAQGGTGGATANAARANLLQLPQVRQTVINGPVDTSGLSAFGGSTGSTTVTASGTLTVTAANGVSGDRVGSITNPSWTGLTASAYLYLDIAADGTCTTGSTTLVPTYRWGGADVTTSGQFTFNIQEMVGKVGNGATAAQTYRVFVGEVTASGTVSAIVWYALQGRYDSGWTNTLPAGSTSVSKNHNTGYTDNVDTMLDLKCLTADAGYTVGDVIPRIGTYSGAPGPSMLRVQRLAASFPTSNAGNPWGLYLAGGGALTSLTAANWAYKVRIQRNW